VPAPQALEVAYLAALERLLAAAEDPLQRRELEWALQEARVAREPVIVEPARLEQYVGDYGSQTVRLRDGRLTYRKGRRTERYMVPLGDDLFLLEGADGFRVRFEREAGRIVRMVCLWSEGHVESSPRDGS
jgi:hypothetical protein